MAATGFAYDFTGITGRVIAVWYKNSNPTAEVGRLLLPTPNGSGNFNVENLHRVLYTFKFFQSSDGTTLETLLRTLQVDASKEKAMLIEPFEYVAGVGGYITPDTNILEDSRLADAKKEELEVDRRGVGILRKDEFELHAGGGVELQNGDTFGEGETIHVKWQHPADVSKTDSSTTAVSEDVVLIPSDTTFNAAIHLNKIIQANGSNANNITFTLPAFSSIPDGFIDFNTNAGQQRYLKIQFASGNSVSFFNANRNRIDLGKGERFKIVFKSGSAYVTSSVKETGYEKAGEPDMSTRKDLPNTVLCEGDGVEYLISDYQRLIDSLPTEMKVTYADWNLQMTVIHTSDISTTYNINRGKFAVNTATGKFKFPDLRGQMFKSLEVYSGTAPYRLSQGAGGLQPKMLIKHSHIIKVTDGDQGNTTSLADGGNSAYSIIESGAIAASTGGDTQLVDSLGKYGIVWI